MGYTNVDTLQIHVWQGKAKCCLFELKNPILFGDGQRSKSAKVEHVDG